MCTYGGMDGWKNGLEKLLWIEWMKGAETETIDGQTDSLFLLQDHQVLSLDVIVGRLQDGLERDETDNFRSGDGHIQLLGVLTGLFVGRMNGRHIVIRQIERDLSHLGFVQPPSDTLDGLESARLIRPSALLSQIQRDPVGLLFGAQHVDVEGDEELSNARSCGSPTRNKFGRPEIRLPFFFCDL